MKINIKVTNIELTQDIKDYVNKKVNSLEKFIHNIDESVQAWVEVGKTTEHHQAGDIYRAEIQIHLPYNKKGIRAVVEKDTIYSAIDEAKEEVKKELIRAKEKKVSMIRRGARALKKITSNFYERKS